MPPPEDVIDNAVDTLSSIQLKRFSAEPASALPLNDVTLSWEASKPSGPVASSVVFKLLGVKVARSGARTIQPAKSATISLSAEAFGVRVVLGSVSINVDLSGCVVHSIPDGELAARFRADLNREFPEAEGKKIELRNLPDLTVRVRNDRTRLTVDTGGMKVSGEFDVEINNAPDGTLSFSALIGLGAENGRPVHTILKFNSDFDFSGTVDIISLGLGKLVDAIIDRVANDDIRKSVDNSVTRMLSDLQAQLAAIPCALSTVSPAVRRVDFTLCPSAPGAVCRLSVPLVLTR